jgi:hypothetical protein
VGYPQLSWQSLTVAFKPVENYLKSVENLHYTCGKAVERLWNGCGKKHSTIRIAKKMEKSKIVEITSAIFLVHKKSD